MAEQSIHLSSLKWLRSLDPVFQLGGVGGGSGGLCAFTGTNVPSTTNNPVPKAYQSSSLHLFFLLGVEVAKLSIKCGDLNILKARKCQIHKQFVNE